MASAGRRAPWRRSGHYFEKEFEKEVEKEVEKEADLRRWVVVVVVVGVDRRHLRDEMITNGLDGNVKEGMS